MELIMIRHTSVDVPRGTCYGCSDVPVKGTFEAEAAATKVALQPYGTPDVVFSSPLTRARKLAAYCGYPTPVVDERLKEMDMGDWEMRRFDDIEDKRLQEWYNDYMNVAPTNGESFPDVYARVAAFLDELRTKPYRRVMVFAHGGVLMSAGIYAGLFSAADCFDHLVPYGGIQVAEI